MKTALATLLLLGSVVPVSAAGSPMLCANEDGASISKYMAFVIDWYDDAPVAAQSSFEVAQTPVFAPADSTLAVEPPRLRPRAAPTPLPFRPDPMIRPVVDAQAVYPAPQPNRVIDFSNIWIIGGYR